MSVLPHQRTLRRATWRTVAAVDDQRHAGVLEHVHRRAVGAFEDVGREHVVGRARAHHARVEADEVGQVGGDAVEVVGGQHDGEAVVVELAEQVQDLVAGAHVDARGGLVDEQQVGRAEQGAGDEHPLLLAAGELADVAVAEVADAEPVEHIGDARAARPGWSTASAGRCGRAISTASATVTGKFQLTVSTCGHVADAEPGRRSPAPRRGGPSRAGPAAASSCPSPTARRSR